MLHPRQEILASLQSLAKDPIVTAHSETELNSILRQLEITSNGLGHETTLEMESTNSTAKPMARDSDVASTNLWYRNTYYRCFLFMKSI